MAVPIFPLVDRIMRGNLAAYLTDAKAQGQSNETIARRLAAEHKISVGSETVRKWCAKHVEEVSA